LHSIIEPITSRCAKFRFKSLPATDLEARIEFICEQEGARLAPGALKTLIECSGGDLRKAITFLQSGYNLQGSDAITSRMISEMAGVIPEEMIQDLIDTVSTNETKQIQKKVQDLMNEGFAGENIVAQVHEVIIKNDTLNTLQKAKIAQVMGTVDIDLVQGADEHLQVLNLMVHIASITAEAN
jgi:replication factor C subunit 2/4